MIKIRYADLPGGLHVRAVARGRDTVIYLVPGLTVDQRRAALRRARSSARMGHGPPLSATGVTCAMVADRIRTTVGNAAAAMRVHPAMFVPITVVILSATVAYFLLMSVTIKVRPPQAGSADPALIPPVAAAAGPSRGSEPPYSRQPGRAGGPAPGSPSPSRPAVPAPRPSGGGRASPGPIPSPTPGPPPPGRGQPPGPAPSPAPSPTPSPSPSPSPTGSGLCVDVGPLGVCLSL